MKAVLVLIGVVLILAWVWRKRLQIIGEAAREPFDVESELEGKE